MALTTIIGYTRAGDLGSVPTILEQYTHTCGYTRAWVDPTDPLLIWLLPDCPVDDVIANLKNNIGNYVVAAYNNHIDQDKHRRILSIVDEIRTHSLNWLGQHTTEEIAQFIADEHRLHGFIIEALVTAGVMG